MQHDSLKPHCISVLIVYSTVRNISYLIECSIILVIILRQFIGRVFDIFIASCEISFFRIISLDRANSLNILFIFKAIHLLLLVEIRKHFSQYRAVLMILSLR